MHTKVDHDSAAGEGTVGKPSPDAGNTAVSAPSAAYIVNLPEKAFLHYFMDQQRFRHISLVQTEQDLLPGALRGSVDFERLLLIHCQRFLTVDMRAMLERITGDLTV